MIKKVLLSPLLSILWMGLGQIYNGQRRKGIGLAALMVVYIPFGGFPLTGGFQGFPLGLVSWAMDYYTSIRYMMRIALLKRIPKHDSRNFGSSYA